MNRSRRSFLKSAGLGFLAFGLPPTFLVRAAGAEQERARQSPGRGVSARRHGRTERRDPVQRPRLLRARPSIAVAEPASGEERAIDLDGFYALHPALAPLKSIYDKRQSGDHSRRRLAGQHAARISTRRITWSSARRESKARRMAGSIDVSVRNAASIRRFAASPSVRKRRACWPARRRH